MVYRNQSRVNQENELGRAECWCFRAPGRPRLSATEAEVTEYRLHRLTCTACGTRTCALLQACRPGRSGLGCKPCLLSWPGATGWASVPSGSWRRPIRPVDLHGEGVDSWSEYSASGRHADSRDVPSWSTWRDAAKLTWRAAKHPPCCQRSAIGSKQPEYRPHQRWPLTPPLGSAGVRRQDSRAGLLGFDVVSIYFQRWQ